VIKIVFDIGLIYEADINEIFNIRYQFLTSLNDKIKVLVVEEHLRALLSKKEY